MLYSDDQVVGILDINPIHHGHALVIPRCHCRDFLELPEGHYTSVLRGAKYITEALMQEFGLEGYNLFSNNGRIAGQSVFHFHLHVTPRFANDNIQFVLNLKSYTGTEMADLGRRLRKRIAEREHPADHR